MLDGGPEVLRDVAMATNFGTQFAIIGFVGYNSDEYIAEIECVRVVAMATNFGTKIAINWLCENV